MNLIRRKFSRILIWGSDRAKFGAPETKYKDASVCVTGGWRTLSTDQHLTSRVALAGGPSFELLERWELFDPSFSLALNETVLNS
jgi:hypothetical protein